MEERTDLAVAFSTNAATSSDLLSCGRDVSRVGEKPTEEEGELDGEESGYRGGG